MLAWYHWTLIGAAAISAALAWNVPRAPMWIALGAISYVTSAMWHNAGWPYATQFGAATNLAICYLMWVFADQRWEMRVWNAFHLMLLIDLLFIFGWIRSQYDFAVSLEIVNLVALIFIGATGIAERADAWRSARGADLHRTGLVHRALWAERSLASRPWWQQEARR
jgi:hypothetical protein